MDRLLTLEEAAQLVRRTPAQMRWMRHNRNGPPSAKVAGRIMYREGELEAWIDEQFANDRITGASTDG